MRVAASCAPNVRVRFTQSVCSNGLNYLSRVLYADFRTNVSMFSSLSLLNISA